MTAPKPTGHLRLDAYYPGAASLGERRNSSRRTRGGFFSAIKRMLALVVDLLIAVATIHFIDRWYWRAPAAAALGVLTSFLVLSISATVRDSAGEAIVGAVLGSPVHALVASGLSILLARPLRRWKDERRATRASSGWRLVRAVPAASSGIDDLQSAPTSLPVTGPTTTSQFTGTARTKAVDHIESLASQDHRYERIGHELASGNVQRGLWTRCFDEADGDDAQTRLRYIRARMRQMERAENKDRASAVSTGKYAATPADPPERHHTAEQLDLILKELERRGYRINTAKAPATGDLEWRIRSRAGRSFVLSSLDSVRTLHQLAGSEEQRILLDSSLAATCPACGTTIARDVPMCRHCGSLFGISAGWKPI